MSERKTNPKNDRAKRDYLIDLKEAMQRSEATVEQARHAIDRLEKYTGFKDFATFNKDQAIAFKQSLLNGTTARTGKPIAIATVHHILQFVRDFLRWLSGQPGYRRRINPKHIAYLNLTMGEERQAHAARPTAYHSVEDYRRAVLAMPAETEIERRDQAIMAMVLAIGARDDALIGLKLKHVDIAKRRVFQDPREVRTKFRKPINAYFVTAVGEDMLDIVRAWVKFLTEDCGFGPDDPLFPKTQVAPDAAGNFAPVGLGREHWADASPVRKIFKEAFERVGLAYVHPHSIRHTLTQLAYALKLPPEEMKAFSQNLGHDSLLTTFTSYGHVSDERQAEIMSCLANKRSATTLNDTMADIIAEKVATKLRSGGAS